MPARPLPFPLKDTFALSALTEIGRNVGEMGAWPTDSDERVVRAIEASLNDWVKLASCIDVGCDIAYPDESVAIWFLWSQVSEAMLICEAVAQCINGDNTALITALNSYLTQASTLNLISDGLRQLERGTTCYCPGFSETIIVEPLGKQTNPGIDLDKLWGQCQATVEFLDQTGRDAIEIIGTWQNTGERIAGALKAIPVLETLPIDEVFGLPAWLADEGYEYYEAGSTIGNKLSFSCELFCLCRDDGNITIDRIKEALNNAANVEFIPADIFQFLDIVGNILTSGIGATFAWWAFQALIVGAAAQAQNFFGAILSWNVWDFIIANGVEGASNGWTVCDCPTDGSWEIWQSRWGTAEAQGEFVENLSNRIVIDATYGSPDPSGGAGYRINIQSVGLTCYTLTLVSVGTTNVAYGCNAFIGGVPVPGDSINTFSTFSGDPHQAILQW